MEDEGGPFDDDGATWSEREVLMEGGPCAYPDCDEAGDGTVFVTFDGDRFDQKELFVRRLSGLDRRAKEGL